MASPFSIFRKHQKGLMAGLIIVAMVSFIVLGTVEQFLGGRGGSDPRENRVVATWKGGKFTQRDVNQIRENRISLNIFINRVTETWAANAGGPVPRPVQYSIEERSVVFSSLLADQAARLGIVVTDEQVLQHIRDLSDDAVNKGQLERIIQAMSAKERPVTFAQIVEAFRREMLAQQAQIVLGSPAGNYDYRATPAERWDYFCRLNRRVKLQAYPFAVEDYISDIRIPDPTDSQLEAFYEKYKDDVASPMSPEPGFKQPDAVKLEYIKADYVKFYDAAKANLSEEEIRADFEKRKKSLRNSLEFDEEMREFDRAQAEREEKAKAKDAGKPVVKAPEPDPTPYEEAIGRFAKHAPRATEPRLTDEEILHRIRDEIVERLAQDRARDDMRKALDDAYQRMLQFSGTEYRRWMHSNAAKSEEDGDDSAGQTPKSPPPTFDLAGLSKPEAGLTYHQTTLMSQAEMVHDKNLLNTFVNRRWGKSNEPGMDVDRQTVVDAGTSLPSYVFQSRTKMSAFRAEDEIGSSSAGTNRNQYAMWITADQKQHVPAFADIKDTVRRAWKIANDTGSSARDLARKQAEQLAQAINGSNDTLKKRFDDGSEVRETGEFTWFEDRVLPIGSGPLPEVRLATQRGELDEIAFAGDRFFREVFRLADAEAGVAMNDAGSVVYVVQVFDAADAKVETLREKFLKATFWRYIPNLGMQMGFTGVPDQQGYSLVSAVDMNRRAFAWFKQLERDYELQWEAPEDDE